MVVIGRHILEFATVRVTFWDEGESILILVGILATQEFAGSV